MLTYLVKDHEIMLQFIFQTPEPRGCEEQDFLLFSYVFLWFQHRTLWAGIILGPVNTI